MNSFRSLTSLDASDCAISFSYRQKRLAQDPTTRRAVEAFRLAPEKSMLLQVARSRGDILSVKARVNKISVRNRSAAPRGRQEDRKITEMCDERTCNDQWFSVGDLPHAKGQPACEPVERHFFERFKEIEDRTFRSRSHTENTFSQFYVGKLCQNTRIMVRVGDRSPISQATVDKLRLPIETPEEAGLPSLVALTWLNVVKREHTQSA
jgi:hypothetical protein